MGDRVYLRVIFRGFMSFFKPLRQPSAICGTAFVMAVLLASVTPLSHAWAQQAFPALDPTTVPGAIAAPAPRNTVTPTAPTIVEQPTVAELFAVPDAPAAASAIDPEAVDFSADHVTYNEPAQTVLATGNVEMLQDGQHLRADEVGYAIGEDKVNAKGNVVLTMPNGDVHRAEQLELTEQMRSGVIKGMLSKLSDGSRFTASEGIRQAGVRTTMRDATYTPCKVCETNPEPLWQLKADKVVHDEVKKTIKYKNARMEFAGVPFFYTPMFAHPDPSVKRKSGFLRPEYGWSSDTGAYLESSYYFGNIAPNIDATLSLRPTMERGILAKGEYRQRFENGFIQLEGSGVESDRDEEDGRIENDRKRGHLFANGLFNLSDTWRTGFDAALVSDKSFLRLYDIESEDILENQLYLERLSGRDYTNIRALSFRDLRLGPRPKQAEIVPELTHRMYGAPKATLGGRWEAGVSSMYLHRGDSDEQDVQRGSADLGWERKFVADMGLVSTLRTSARVDAYKVLDNNLLPPGSDNETDDVRGNAVLSLVSSYPVQKRFESVSWLVEPIFGVALSPQLDEKEFDIPNEDSLDIMIDTSNLFSDNRFAGIDRQEDGTRINYGFKTGLFGDGGNYGTVYLGQTRRFDNAAYYPQGSGLEDKDSAYVGQITVGIDKILQGDYRVQIDSDTLSAQRHEFGATSTLGNFTNTGRYMYINGIQGTDFLETREQAELTSEYRFTPVWTGYGTALYDLGEEPGLRRARLGLGYADECFSFALEGTRNLTNDAAGESETSIMARIGFKNIGEFSGPEIAFKSETEQ